MFRSKQATHLEIHEKLLVSEEEHAVGLQIYRVMILAMLLQPQIGRRPTQQMIELLHFHAQGRDNKTEVNYNRNCPVSELATFPPQSLKTIT